MKVIHLCSLPLVPGHPDYGKIFTHPGRWALSLAIAQQKHSCVRPVLVSQIPGSRNNHHTEIDGIPVFYLAAPNRFRSTTLFFFDARRISRFVSGLCPDLVHAHGTEDAYALAGLACRKPFVLTAQGCLFLINREVPPKLFSRERVVQWTERRALTRTQDIIAKSDYVAKGLQKAFPHLRVCRIPNSVDTRWLNESEKIQKMVGHLAFVGTVVPRKGVDQIRMALQIIQERHPGSAERIHLHIFGNRAREQAEKYERQELGLLRGLLGERLHLHGIVPFHKMPTLLGQIPLLVAPSREEMFGNQVVEAMLVGAFPIVTERTAMSENVNKMGFGCTIPSRVPEKLAEAILTHVFRPAAMEKIQAVRAKVMEQMGPMVVAEQHQALYEKIILENKP